MRLVVLAPAKVNLVLRVGPRRADGYHEILSLLVPLDLADTVEVNVAARTGGVTCRVPGRPDLDGESNLAARAAALVKERFGRANGIGIRIAKRIPVTAGLGGGSSDAAAVIRALSRAFRIRDRAALREIALQVGSDVPFFLTPGPAWARGRGERLTPARVPALDLVLLYPSDPSLAIRAKDAYAWLDEDRIPHAPSVPLRTAAWRPGILRNDLEPPCVERHPSLSGLMGLLVEHGARPVIMSGSGPTVFGLYESRWAARGAARTIVKEVAGAKVKVLAVRTLVRQPRVVPWRSPRSASSRSTRRS
ncbi:MAG TPA: 4-(cytidine 5'-diphospho)-2-C-methyl-D-erythritol kinase [Anaeromyxobacter sp.]